MQVRLVPLACPELGVIDIRDDLFGIGRDRGAFKKLPDDRAQRLSRRHARLYDNDGALYVVDLGSQHGTFVNGQSVSTKPVELKHGDEVDFGGALGFRVELPQEPAVLASSDGNDPALILEPVDPDQGPDPVVIRALPFLVGKNTEAFAKHRDLVPAEVDFLSRRHAQLSRKEGRILLQDLGSTNGTLVGGQPIGEEGVFLEDGQTVAFGGDYFVYRAVLKGSDPAGCVEKPLPIQASSRPQGEKRPQVEKTTFVSAGTSFLDILCAEDPQQAAEKEMELAAKPDQKSDSVGSRKRGLTGLGALIRVLMPGDRGPSGRLLALLAIVAAAVLTAGYLALRESPTERIQSLLADGRVDEALTLARAKAPVLHGDTAFDRLALRALVAKTLSPWLDAYEAADFAAMQAVVASGRDISPAQTGVLDYIDTLSLIATVQETVLQRGGTSAPLRVLDEESARVRETVERWERPHPDKRKVTERLLNAIPPDDSYLLRRYREVYREAASNIRALQSQLAVYEPAGQQIEAAIARHLRDGSLDELAADLDRLAARYSQFGGFDELQRDLANYRELMTLAAQERVLDAHRMVSAINFHAQAFQSAAQRLIREQLPPKDFLDSYAGALEAWQSGEIEAAIAQLESLLSSPGSAIAQREMGRIEEIVREVNALRRLEPSELYDEQLLSLYHSLDRDRDRHIVTLLQAEYEDSLAATEIRAQGASAVAANAWADYRERGGISSTQRLKTHIDEVYKESAALLSQAGRAAREARRLYEQARLAIPSEEAATLAMIQKEIALQHQALDELAGVLQEPRLLEMRALLPTRAR